MKTILIVEDDLQMNNIIKQRLIKLGFSVLQAFDGETAVRIYNDNKLTINMIFLDMNLPDLNGSDCILLFRKINKHVRIIICSGLQYDYKSLGALNEIQKPFTYDELKEMCDKYI